MARKKQPVIKASPAAPVAAPPASDLEVLHPERSAAIAGRQVTVREYGFIEGLRLQTLFAPFADDLYARISAGGDGQLDEIVESLGRHAELIAELIAISADVELEWVRSLDDAAGSNLMYLWWTVNAPFFMRRVFARLATDRAMAKVRAGATSMPSSSSTATSPQK